jgi:hypothetical protein
MKKLALLCVLLGASLHGAPSPAFYKALHAVETSSRHGPIPGDFVNGKPRSLGPLQISRKYFLDSGVPGRYEQVASYEFSVRVVAAYLRKYAPRAYARGDASLDVLARIHNGGPTGHQRSSTLRYAQRVQAAISRSPGAR